MTKCLFLVLIFLVVQNIQNCPDRWALHKVDVWRHRFPNSTGELIKSISMYDLDGFQMVEVMKANVSVLCDGMIKNFPRLKYLSLVEANISKIQPGAFQNLPSLTHLSLAVNHLASIERYQFQNLASLRILYLSKNQVENVEKDAFIDLVDLRKVYLDRNKIHEIDSRWFLSNNQISLIDLAFNNISKVQKGAFTLPKNGKVEIRLNNNEIEEVEPDAVTSKASEEEIPYLTLHLDRNKLTDIKHDFIKSMDKFHSNLTFNNNIIQCFAPKTLQILKEVSLELHANSNPLSCDCLEAATNFVNDHELTASFHYSSTMDCELPGLKPDSWNQQNMYFTK